jgi:hypothetical protein
VNVQQLSTITIKSRDESNRLGQRSSTFPLNGIHLCGASVGSAVLLRYSRQLVGSCTINELFPVKLKVKIKFTLEQATKFKKGSRSIALHLL